MSNQPDLTPSTKLPVAQPARLRRVRLWPALLIIVLASGRLAWIWFGWAPDPTMQTMHTYLTIGPAILALLVWWTFFSGFSWRVRLRALGIGAALVGVASLLVRVEEVTGEVVPILSWRWTPSRKESAQRFLDQQPRSNARTKAAAPTNGDATSAGPAKLEIGPEDFPAYRGAQRDGIVRHASIRTDWNENPPQALWRQPVGLGWSGFAVVDGLVFTQEQRRAQEAIVCYDAESGKQIWVHEDEARFSEALGGDGPRATPTVYDGKLYTMGATGILNCLDARTGKVVWSHSVLEEHGIPNIPWGMAGSPLVYDDVVVINSGGERDQALMAYDRLTGRIVWTAGKDQASYSAPQLSVVDGVQQILLFDGAGIAGHDPENGRQLWKFPWTNQAKVNASQPFVTAADEVFISNGYGVGSALLRVTHSGEQWSAISLWESKKLRLKFNAGVLQDHYIYGLDEGILACFDLHAQRQTWKGGRYGFGQLLLVGKSLVILTEAGELVLVEAQPERFAEVARFQAIEGKTWNNFAVWKGLVFVRNADEAACYDLRLNSPRKASQKSSETASTSVSKAASPTVSETKSP